MTGEGTSDIFSNAAAFRKAIGGFFKAGRFSGAQSNHGGLKEQPFEQFVAMRRTDGAINFTARDFSGFSQSDIRPELTFVGKAIRGIDNSGYAKG